MKTVLHRTHGFHERRSNQVDSPCGSLKKDIVAEIMKSNESVIGLFEKTDEHLSENESKNAPGAMEAAEGSENLGTMILDATCSPSNIQYPQDFSLLNEAREKLEEMIDFFNKAYHPWKKPRTYRKVARKEYLELAKAKKRTAEKSALRFESSSDM